MEPIEVVSLVRLAPEQAERIRAVDDRVRLTEAAGWFDGEIRETWPAFTVERYLPPDSHGYGTREERDALLARADVILGSWPFPRDLLARAKRLKWYHQNQAGANNLRLGDLWGASIAVTTARGHANPQPIAETAVAGIFHFARGLHRAPVDRERRAFDHRAYAPFLVTDKSVCVIGTGGIGRRVATMCRALGMRTLGIKRHVPDDAAALEEFDEIGGPDDLHAFLARSRFVAICAQWTPETTGLIGREAFAAMAEDAVLINVSRGEIVDEGALAEALDGGRLRGALLDVYTGEFEHPPPERLWSDPRVVLTPHVSGHSDRHMHSGIGLFCDNLAAFIQGRPLENTVDWDRGY